MEDNLLERGMKLYEERLKSELEPELNGRIVVVEVESGDYFLGQTANEAYKKAKEKHPDKPFAFLRVGAKAAFFVGACQAPSDNGVLGGRHAAQAPALRELLLSRRSMPRRPDHVVDPTGRVRLGGSLALPRVAQALVMEPSRGVLRIAR